MKKLLVVFSYIAFTSCQSPNSSESELSNDSVNHETSADSGNAVSETLQETVLDSIFILDNYLVNNTSVKKDFSFITESCGIFVKLDTVQIAKMQKEYGEEDFATMADDDAFYDYHAAEFLDKMHVKSIYPTARYLKFKVNGDTMCMDTKSKFNTQGMTILYKINTLPKIYGSIDIEQAYNSYFGTQQ